MGKLILLLSFVSLMVGCESGSGDGTYVNTSSVRQAEMLSMNWSADGTHRLLKIVGNRYELLAFTLTANSPSSTTVDQVAVECGTVNGTLTSVTTLHPDSGSSYSLDLSGRGSAEISFRFKAVGEVDGRYFSNWGPYATGATVTRCTF